jgi:predicted RND superfamily exporter protein
MEDYLERLSSNLGIKLIYTSNKVTVLSCSYKNDIPVIRAHNIFKNSTNNLANAIIGYYTDLNTEKENLKIIEEYIRENFSGKLFKIEPYNETFKRMCIKNIPVEEIHEKSLEKIAEYKISSMVQTDFYGNKLTLKPEETLQPSQDDILELDITVLPSLT